MLTLYVVVEILECPFAARTDAVADTLFDLRYYAFYGVSAVPEMRCLFLVIVTVLADALILLDEIRNLFFQFVCFALFVTPIDSAVWAGP